MRKLLAMVVLAGSITLSGRAANPEPAQSQRDTPKNIRSAVTLKVGDPAPPLKASKWLQGEEVKEFKPGQVYVLDFWAIWCGLCIITMPETAELQRQYKDQGVTIIGFSARDPNNSQEQVVALVKKRGPKLLPYTFAYADDQATYEAWMTAAGRQGLPCVFVVDKKGRIAYIGHPIYLGVVLPLVVAGNKDAKEVAEEMARVEQEFNAVSAALWPDNKAGLKALKDFEAKYPPLANNPAILRAKLSLLPRIGEIAEAKKVAEAVVAKAIQQSNPGTLGQVAALLRNGPGKESQELLALAVKAAEAAVLVAGEKDAKAIIDLAETYFAAGDTIKAREYSRKAVEAAAHESDSLKRYIEQQAKKIDGEKKPVKQSP